MVAAPETNNIESTEKSVCTENKIEKPEMTEAKEIQNLSEEEKREKLEKCTELMKNGRKFLIQNKPQEAVASLADGLAVMREFNDELDVSMCEFYFFYGKALLEVARIEDDVLGNALAGVPEGEDTDNSQVEDPDKLSQNEEEEVGDEDVAESQDEEEEEDVPSIQLAFEVLDLARVIYTQKQERSREESLKLSQVYLKLGEVAMENENFTDAASMYKDCLELQKSLLSPDDRWLAETHYQLGAAYTMASDFDAGLLHANSAVEVIKARIQNRTQDLEKEGVKVSEEPELSSLTEEQQGAVTELKELKTLLPELEEKIADIQASKDSTVKKLQTLMSGFSAALGGGSSGKSAFEEANGSGPSGASPKAVSSSLIRKKRKPEDEVTSDAAKKQKTEEDTSA